MSLDACPAELERQLLKQLVAVAGERRRPGGGGGARNALHGRPAAWGMEGRGHFTVLFPLLRPQIAGHLRLQLQRSLARFAQTAEPPSKTMTAAPPPRPPQFWVVVALVAASVSRGGGRCRRRRRSRPHDRRRLPAGRCNRKPAAGLSPAALRLLHCSSRSIR